MDWIGPLEKDIKLNFTMWASIFYLFGIIWISASVFHDNSPNLSFFASDMDGSNDVALYSGLGAGIIAVAILVVAVMLYRKNHSEYGVDVIDSSALAGGFQSFNFKTTRQGKRERLHADTHQWPQGQKAASSKTSATGPPRWLMAFVGIEQPPYLLKIYTSRTSRSTRPSILTNLLLCYCDAEGNQSLIETAPPPPPPPRTTHLTVRQPISSIRLHRPRPLMDKCEAYGTVNINPIFVVHSNNFCWLCGCGCPGQLRYRHSYCRRWHFWVSASDSHRGEGWSIHAAAVTAPWGAHCAPLLPQGLGSRSSPTPSSRVRKGMRKNRGGGTGRWYEPGLHSAGHQSYLNRPACLLCPPPATITPFHFHLFQLPMKYWTLLQPQFALEEVVRTFCFSLLLRC